MNSFSKITGGIYLIIDPGQEEKTLFEALQKALKAKPSAVQIWDNFKQGTPVSLLIRKIKTCCKSAGIPLFINNHPEWVGLFDLDGVHFDEVEHCSKSIVETFHRMEKVVGVTINNDLERIINAIEMGVDYLSFCSIFPSSTSTSCVLVDFETIRQTRKLTNTPIFLAGGIHPHNIEELHTLDFEGVAVVSGVMNATDPSEAIRSYKHSLSNLKK